MNRLIIVGVLAFGVFAFGIYGLANALSKKCIRSHTEVQYVLPPSVVSGGGKYGGGIAIPIGNAKAENVEVCDEREK